jgi:hypothetical protein
MNRLDRAKRAQIVRCLVEGCSIRSTVRMTCASKNTIAKLLVELGACCVKFMDETMVPLPSNGFRLTKFGASRAARKECHYRESINLQHDEYCIE